MRALTGTEGWLPYVQQVGDTGHLSEIGLTH
jgi:hypothetical protein